jgi:lupus La protein
VKQFEFYFSDSNLPNDKFLKQEVADNEGWARLAVLGSFARVKALETDPAKIVEALKTSDKLEVSEDGHKVRRTAPLAEDTDLSSKTLYVKGLDAAWSLDQVAEYFQAQGVNVVCVRLCHTKADGEKKRTGAAFVEVATEEEAKAAAAKEFKPEGGDALTVSLKSAFVDARKAEKKAKEDAEAAAAAAAAAAEAKEAAFEANLLFSVANIGADGSRETIRKWVESVEGKTAYIDFERGLTDAKVRLTKDCGLKADAAVAKLSAQGEELKVGDAVPVFAVISGAEEEGVWAALEEKRAAMKALAARNAAGGNKRRNFGNNSGSKRGRR